MQNSNNILKGDAGHPRDLLFPTNYIREKERTSAVSTRKTHHAAKQGAAGPHSSQNTIQLSRPAIPPKLTPLQRSARKNVKTVSFSARVRSSTRRSVPRMSQQRRLARNPTERRRSSAFVKTTPSSTSGGGGVVSSQPIPSKPKEPGQF